MLTGSILGWHGLAMAKAYLETRGDKHELPNVVLMDAGTSVGGTWAEDRIYPGLKTNNLVGSYEFSDFPLGLEDYGMRPGQHIPGHTVHRYLSDFADHFDISPRIRFRTKVTAASLQGDGTWLVDYSATRPGGAHRPSGVEAGRLVARKIAVATGLTSEPSVPAFAGQGSFEGSVFHSRALGDRAGVLASSRSVVVVGGNKSAWDACYAAALSGARVRMLVRPSGGGPSRVWRPRRPGGFSISRLSSTRLVSWFDPSPFGRRYQAARGFLRRTWLGQLLTVLFWHVLDYCAGLSAGYHDDDGGDGDDDVLAKLRPWSSTFWMGNSLSVHNYETDWFDLARSRRITVHHAEITSLDVRSVHLSDGEVVEADALVTCTGWKNACTIDFGPHEVATALGLPGRSGSGRRAELADADLIARAHKEVLQRYPELLKRPIRFQSPRKMFGPGEGQGQEKPETSPRTDCFRLYHSIVPASEAVLKHRNLAFVGVHHSIHTAMVAQAQALWATAFFQARVPTVSPEDVDRLRYEAYLEAEYERCRRPKEGAGAGGQYLDLVFDTVPYVDMLLEDVGVRARRKTSWWRDIFEPYSIRDYAGIVGEWISSGSGSGDEQL